MDPVIQDLKDRVATLQTQVDTLIDKRNTCVGDNSKYNLNLSMENSEPKDKINKMKRTYSMIVYDVELDHMHVKYVCIKYKDATDHNIQYEKLKKESDFTLKPLLSITTIPESYDVYRKINDNAELKGMGVTIDEVTGVLKFTSMNVERSHLFLRTIEHICNKRFDETYGYPY